MDGSITVTGHLDEGASQCRRRLYRPWVPVPGRHLVIDWTSAKAGLQMI